MKLSFRSLSLAASLVAFAGTSVDAQSGAAAHPSVAVSNDPFVWLEQVSSPRSMAWVNAENAKTVAVLEKDPHYAGLYADAVKLAEARDRIPSPSVIGGQIYNFWQDAEHTHGVWRRTTLASYRSASPAWTTVLDLDALSKSEKANWFWKGSTCAEPAERHCMVQLSDGG
jgi:prolyl oligopeptidase